MNQPLAGDRRAVRVEPAQAGDAAQICEIVVGDRPPVEIDNRQIVCERRSDPLIGGSLPIEPRRRLGRPVRPVLLIKLKHSPGALRGRDGPCPPVGLKREPRGGSRDHGHHHNERSQAYSWTKHKLALLPNEFQSARSELVAEQAHSPLTAQFAAMRVRTAARQPWRTLQQLADLEARALSLLKKRRYDGLTCNVLETRHVRFGR